MEDCIFCKIIKGEVPCKKILETEKTISFLDINPVTPGHILIIPKEHYENIFETPDVILEEINTTCKKIAILVKKKLNATGVNVLNSSGKDAQQEVFHLHYHVIPRYKNDTLKIHFNNNNKHKISTEEIYGKLISK